MIRNACTEVHLWKVPKQRIAWHATPTSQGQQGEQEKGAQGHGNVGALKFIGFQVMSSLAVAENSKPGEVKMLAKIAAAHAHNNTNTHTHTEAQLEHLA